MKWLTFDQSELLEAVEYCKQEFKFSVGGKGNTLRDQLNSVWRQTGVKPKQLDELKELPESCAEVWFTFLKLHNARQGSGFGVSPIAYSEIQAYTNLYQIELEEWELDLLRMFDQAVLEIIAEEQEKKSTAKNKPA